MNEQPPSPAPTAANQHQNRAKDAAAWLDQARLRLAGPDFADGVDWQEWTALQALRREAEGKQ